MDPNVEKIPCHRATREAMGWWVPPKEEKEKPAAKPATDKPAAPAAEAGPADAAPPATDTPAADAPADPAGDKGEDT
jgi:hypothetical protein